MSINAFSNISLPNPQINPNINMLVAQNIQLPKLPPNQSLKTDASSNIVTSGSLSGVTISAVDSFGVPNPNGGTLTGNNFNLNSANSSNPGVLNTGTQTISGLKTFPNKLTTSALNLIPPLTLVAPVTVALSYNQGTGDVSGVDVESTNTASSIVFRDSSGNFSSNNITGNNLIASSGFKLSSGAGVNKLLQSDASGNGTWQTVSTAIYPTRGTMWHYQSLILSGSPLQLSTSASSFFNLYAFQGPPFFNGDTFTNSFMLAPGNYTFSVMGVLGTNIGIVDWYLDNVKTVTQDWYSAATTFNTIKTAPVTIVGSGQHVLKGIINGKNGASTDFALALNVMYFTPATDTINVV
jgi:hypothetical protein